MLKLRKFNVNIFLIFEVRAKEPFTDNTVKIEETETEKLRKSCMCITGVFKTQFL